MQQREHRWGEKEYGDADAGNEVPRQQQDQYEAGDDPQDGRWRRGQADPLGRLDVGQPPVLTQMKHTQARATAPLVALAVTIGLHLWRSNALLSILGGTACRRTS